MLSLYVANGMFLYFFFFFLFVCLLCHRFRCLWTPVNSTTKRQPLEICWNHTDASSSQHPHYQTVHHEQYCRHKLQRRITPTCCYFSVFVVVSTPASNSMDTEVYRLEPVRQPFVLSWLSWSKAAKHYDHVIQTEQRRRITPLACFVIPTSSSLGRHRLTICQIPVLDTSCSLESRPPFRQSGLPWSQRRLINNNTADTDTPVGRKTASGILQPQRSLIITLRCMDEQQPGLS